MKVNKASFLQRLFAWLIDQTILMILYLLAVFAVGLTAELYDRSNLNVPNLLLSLGVNVFLLALLLGHFLYFGYFWSRRERSAWE